MRLWRLEILNRTLSSASYRPQILESETPLPTPRQLLRLAGTFTLMQAMLAGKSPSSLEFLAAAKTASHRALSLRSNGPFPHLQISGCATRVFEESISLACWQQVGCNGVECGKFAWYLHVWNPRWCPNKVTKQAAK